MKRLRNSLRYLTGLVRPLAGNHDSTFTNILQV